ncbi:hypothetical protein WN48_10846 [Eufriesea mexicana]|uniref:Elongation of very long chain fatty acids protein n=1 Tax=Eufriesea mexicana TaxID=516756 RepID=A0A310S617_9HYME|nr:hypothetical protein WN48_10846 [Eufriesea mexicana]
MERCYGDNDRASVHLRDNGFIVSVSSMTISYFVKLSYKQEFRCLGFLMNASTIPHVDRMSNIYNNSAVRFYHHIFHDLSDPRTREWFLIPSPVPGASILIGYLYFVLSWGPRHMQHRKPYQLKNILVLYNFLQVLLSTWLFYEGLDAAWLRKYSWKCQPVDFSNTPEALRASTLSIACNNLCSISFMNCNRYEYVGQFCLAFLHSCQLLFYDCDYPKWSLILILPNAVFFYFLFADFYSNAYEADKKHSKSIEGKENGVAKKVANGNMYNGKGKTD